MGIDLQFRVWWFCQGVCEPFNTSVWWQSGRLRWMCNPGEFIVTCRINVQHCQLEIKLGSAYYHIPCSPLLLSIADLQGVLLGFDANGIPWLLQAFESPWPIIQANAAYFAGCLLSQAKDPKYLAIYLPQVRLHTWHPYPHTNDRHVRGWNGFSNTECFYPYKKKLIVWPCFESMVYLEQVASLLVKMTATSPSALVRAKSTSALSLILNDMEI